MNKLFLFLDIIAKSVLSLSLVLLFACGGSPGIAKQGNPGTLESRSKEPSFRPRDGDEFSLERLVPGNKAAGLLGLPIIPDGHGRWRIGKQSTLACGVTPTRSEFKVEESGERQDSLSIKSGAKILGFASVEANFERELEAQYSTTTHWEYEAVFEDVDCRSGDALVITHVRTGTGSRALGYRQEVGGEAGGNVKFIKINAGAKKSNKESFSKTWSKDMAWSVTVGKPNTRKLGQLQFVLNDIDGKKLDTNKDIKTDDVIRVELFEEVGQSAYYPIVFHCDSDDVDEITQCGVVFPTEYGQRIKVPAGMGISFDVLVETNVPHSKQNLFAYAVTANSDFEKLILPWGSRNPQEIASAIKDKTEFFDNINRYKKSDSNPHYLFIRGPEDSIQEKNEEIVSTSTEAATSVSETADSTAEKHSSEIPGTLAEADRNTSQEPSADASSSAETTLTLQPRKRGNASKKETAPSLMSCQKSLFFECTSHCEEIGATLTEKGCFVEQPPNAAEEIHVQTTQPQNEVDKRRLGRNLLWSGAGALAFSGLALGMAKHYGDGAINDDEVQKSENWAGVMIGSWVVSGGLLIPGGVLWGLSRKEQREDGIVRAKLDFAPVLGRDLQGFVVRGSW